jgi:catechol-2,3-dioxygenase
MQNLLKEKAPFEVEIEATSHAWRKPFVILFEKLFRAGEAIRIGKTTLYVKDPSGNVIHQEYYGKSRKAAWYRKLEIEKKMKVMSGEELLHWLKKGDGK